MIFSWVDWAILVIILASSVISLFRGFVREVFSLLTWVTALIVTWVFRSSLADTMVDYVLSPTMRIIFASIILFVMTLMVGGLVSSGLARLVRATGLSNIDRSMGVIFGSLRGVLMISVVVSIAVNTTVVEENWWQNSWLIPLFEEISNWLIGLVSDVFQSLSA